MCYDLKKFGVQNFSCTPNRDSIICNIEVQISYLNKATAMCCGCQNNNDNNNNNRLYYLRKSKLLWQIYKIKKNTFRFVLRRLHVTFLGSRHATQGTAHVPRVGKQWGK